MSITTDGDNPKRPKMALGEKQAKARQAAQSKSRSTDSPSNWAPWSLETHLKKGQLDMVVNGALPLPPSPKPGSNFPIIRDVHGPLEQLDRLISDLEQSGEIDRAAWLRMAEILSVIDRSDRTPPTWGAARRVIARMCLAFGYSSEEDDPLEYISYRDDGGGDDGDRELPEVELPPTVGPETWEAWTPEEAAAAGQGVIDI